MISSIFHTILYKPLYNALVFLTVIMPGADVGWSVVLLTIAVRLVLLPMTHKQMMTQKKLKLVEGELKGIKEKYPDDKQEQTKAMMDLYKKHGINPFSGFALLIVQIPILLALFWVFTRGVPFTGDALYSFVHLPEAINFKFLGLFDLSSKNIFLALLVGVSQFFQIKLSLPPTAPRDPNAKPDFGAELTRSMGTNMKYVMPAFVAIIAAGFPSVVALYWLTSNSFMIAHELIVRRRAKAIAG